MSIENLSQQAAAALLSVTARSLRDWEKAGEGIPRNDDGTYSGPALVGWFVSRQTGEVLDLNEQKARLAKWQADKTEMDVTVRAGELVPIVDVERWYGNHIERCRARLIQLADSIRQFCDPRTADFVVGEVRRIVYEALAELAAPRPQAGQSDIDEVETASDPDGEPVGGREPPPIQRVKRRAGAVANQ